MKFLSAVVLTYQNSRTIHETLNSLKDLAAEIVVVDSGSIDGTLEIAREMAHRVVEHPFGGFASQRAFAYSQASSPWILSIDADETVSKGLAQWLAALPENPSEDGFSIPVLTFFMSRPLRFGGMYPDLHLRLFRRDRAMVQSLKVHEGITVDGPLGRAPFPILHKPYASAYHLVEKMNMYARLAAEQLRADGHRSRAGTPNLLFRPLWSFFVKFVLRLGFLDGAPGFIFHVSHAFYVFSKYAMLRESYAIKEKSSAGAGSTDS